MNSCKKMRLVRRSTINVHLRGGEPGDEATVVMELSLEGKESSKGALSFDSRATLHLHVSQYRSIIV